MTQQFHALRYFVQEEASFFPGYTPVLAQSGGIMEEYTSEIEFSINTGNEESDSTVHELLSSLSLEELLERTLRAVGIMQPAILTLIVTDDATIQSLNKRYRQQDKPTDVLSFPLPDKPLVDAPADQLWTFAEGHNEEETEAVRSTPTFVTPSELPTNLAEIVISWLTIVRQPPKPGLTAANEISSIFVLGILN